MDKLILAIIAAVIALALDAGYAPDQVKWDFRFSSPVPAQVHCMALDCY